MGPAATIVHDVEYLPGRAAQIHVPAEHAHSAADGPPYPSVLVVPGGAWVAGDRTTVRSHAEMLAERGLLAMAIDLGLAPEHPFPAPVADIAAALKWLTTDGRALGADPARLTGFGLSSGGHQLLLAALCPSDPRWDAAVRVRFDRVACAYPVADPPARYAFALETGREDLRAAHDAYWRDLEQMRAGSPQRIVEDGDAERLPSLFLLQGTEDANLPEGSAQRFVDAYRQAGGDARLAMFGGAAHGFIDESTPGTIAAIARFLRGR